MYTGVVILKDDDWGTHPGEELNNQKRWLGSVIEHKAKASLGVIGSGYPEVLTAIGYIARENPGNVELFSHGFSHLVVRNATHNYNEFRGTSASSQNYSLWRSKQVARELMDYDYKVFGAPGNAYEETTFSLLGENGFAVMFNGGGSDVGDYLDNIRPFA